MFNSFAIGAHQAPLSMGFPRQEYWSRLPFPSSENHPYPGIGPMAPAWQMDSLPLSHWSLLKLMFIQSVMPSNHLILHCPVLLLPSIFTHISLRVFPNESVVCIRLLNYWSFSSIISPSIEYSGLISFWIDWFDLLPDQGTLKGMFIDWR